MHMSLKILISCLAVSFAFRHRIDVANGLVQLAKNETQANLCGRWLVVEYNNGKNKTTEDAVYGSFRFLEGSWQNSKLFEKQESDGCVKTYHANCELGALVVTKNCPGGKASEESRCLGGMTCLTSSRRSDLHAGDTMTIYDPDDHNKELSEGGVKVYTIDPTKGINLRDAPGNYKWKAEWGCYCCKHKYDLLDNPFSMSSRRLAWKRGSDGNMECMLAWSMIGNAMGEDPVNAPAWAVFALIPEFILTAADMMTLTVGRHLACAATCPLRKAEFEANKYSYTKIQTGTDMF